MTNFHTPVLLKETINYLNVQPGEKYIDATLGAGGHSIEIIKKGGQVLGIDHDPQALDEAKKRLKSAYPPARKTSGLAQKPYQLTRGNFKNISKIASHYSFSPVSGILFDLGASSHQLTSKHRGFSFQENSDLDMRMDPDLAVTAKDLVNALGRKELHALFTRFSQEKRARAIAAAIVRTRRQNPIQTTKELADIVAGVYKHTYKKGGKRRLHPATKVFQALRIAVNDELNSLEAALPQALKLLKPNGRLVVISFHEGEDRIAKQFIKQNKTELESLTKKPITPSIEEINQNPRSRSAKLRAAAKISDEKI